MDMVHQHSHITHKKQATWAWIQHNIERLLLAGLSIFFILVGAFFIWVATLKVPTISSFTDQKISSSTKIYDRTGTVVLYDVNSNIKRTIVSTDQISPLAKEALVAIEDKNFYHNIGIEPKSILRAVIADLVPFIKKPTEGGSTITQQLIKNALLSQQQSISRKIKEWVLAIKLERVMSKDEILTAYLNEVPYGGTVYGIEEASQTFFGVSAQNIDLAEAAYLAAIPNAPSHYSPYGPNLAALGTRKNLVLKDMLAQGFITQDQYTQASTETVTFLPQENGKGKALHFVQYIEQYLENKYGQNAVLSGGLKVTTTLDWGLQQIGEQTILANALSNTKAYNATNSALVAIDPRTGQILSMVGSRNYFDKQIDGAFNVALAGRQPGSSFKPIVYARAFEKGFTPETVLFDIPTQFGPCAAFDFSDTSPCYAPHDYDKKWPGPLSLRDALAQSRDVPAVQLLAMIGLTDAVQTAQKLGITSLNSDPSRYGLTLVLGGGEVSLLDMTSTYSVFANDGVKNSPTGILEVDDAQGNILEKYTQNPIQVMDHNAVRNLSSVLSDNVARTPLFGPNSFFYFGGQQVAGKTGTTNNDRDAWVFGYTPSIAVGVWSGNNNNTAMTSGSSISGPAWHTFMSAALKALPYSSPGTVETFPSPDPDPNYDNLAPVLRGKWWGNTSFWVDTVSGKLATNLTPSQTKKEVVLPNPHSILYWIDPSNPTGPAPADPTKNSQYSRWEAEFQQYIGQHSGIIPQASTEPVGTDDVHTVANEPQVALTSPTQTIAISSTDPVTLQTTITSPANYPITKVDYYLNGQFIGTSTNITSYTFDPTDSNVTTGVNQLKIIATDSVYNQGELDTTIKFK